MGLASGGTNFSELKDLLVGYAKQETVDPLKALGRYLAFGLAGSFLIGLGSVFVAVGLLRLFQRSAALDGNWSFAPYLLTLVVLVVAAGAAGLGIKRTKDAEQRRTIGGVGSNS